MCPSSRFLALFGCLFYLANVTPAEAVRASDYSSIQEALDRNPGKVIEVPDGDYLISKPIEIHNDNSGLCGPGRIIQGNPEASILELRHAKNIQIRDLTLTRSEGKQDATGFGVRAKDCANLTLQGLQVLENRSQSASIEIDGGYCPRILNCTICNYMRIGVDDRTDSDDWGFAFNVIDGTGIDLRDCRGGILRNNTITESEFLPTRELKKKYRLGQFCKRNSKKGTIISQEMWNEGYDNGWHQGSAICLATPQTDDYIRVLGNYIENAAQGVDIHADHVIMSQNIINNAFMGMKAMHGSRNIIVTENQFSRNDLWSIGFMPGAASRPAGVVAHKGEKPEDCVANVDGGSVIANNIISDFGYGTAYWMWKDMPRSPMKFDTGQKSINPPLANVLIQGNIIYDTGRDGVLENGKAVIEPPRYKYAVSIAGGSGAPRNLHFSNNLFHPGTNGVSNIRLKP